MREQLDDLRTRIDALQAELTRLKTLAAKPSLDTVPPRVAPPAAEDTAEPTATRRDLLRHAAVAFGAVASAGMSAASVEAADGGPVLISGDNTGNDTTYLTSTNGFGFWAKATNGGYGLLGQSVSVGSYGSTTGINGAGVEGVSSTSTGQAPGVRGYARSPNAPGVLGINAKGGNAVRAEIPASTTTNAIALYSLNYSTYTGASPGAGGFAIYGLSANGHGLVGATAAAGAAAIVGATNGVAGAYAAAFYGPVIVGGDFTVVGGAKSAAVRHPDGSHRRLYCLESPESWFEDFGEAVLVCGEASIALDPDFAAVVDTSKYHVFLSGYDAHSELAVFDRSSGGFTVRARERSEGTFSWRVVARRKDIAGARLERVEILKAPTLPEARPSDYAEPEAPTDPRKPTRSR